MAGVPAKLSARARLFPTGQGRKTDPVDAHSVALAGLHSPGLRVITADDATVALRLLADRRDELGAARTQTINRLHRLLLELLPGVAKKFLSAAQAKDLLATVRPRDIAGKTRRRPAAELVTELTRIGRRIKTGDAELKELVTATSSSVLTLHGIGLSGAARLLGDIARFADKGRFASWNAPRDASSGDQNRRRLSRAGNRRINRVLHIMLADIVYRQMTDDARRARATGPGGHMGTATGSSVAGSDPAPALRRSHFPDPPPTTLRRAQPASRSVRLRRISRWLWLPPCVREVLRVVAGCLPARLIA